MGIIPSSDHLLALALAEDLGVEPACFLGQVRPDPGLLGKDVTSAAIIPGDAVFCGRVTAREAGVVCGLPLVERVFDLLASAAGQAAVRCSPAVSEGSDVVAGSRVLEVEGLARVVLAGERTALDLVMVLSGIATEARRWQKAAKGLVVTDTRKTLPGLRALSKYAVRVGGATNHRMGLYDMVLVKDNHIVHAGGVADAVRAARIAAPGMLVECEADTLEQAVEAARAGADIVLLDNMDDEMLARAVAAVREAAAGRKCLTEASGGITYERLDALIRAGVDRVSTSALSLARPMDFALDAS